MDKHDSTRSSYSDNRKIRWTATLGQLNYEVFKEQAAALKAIGKSWKINVETSPYDPHFVDMVKKSEKRGNYKTIDPADVWGSLRQAR